MKILFTADLQLGAGIDLGFGEFGEGSRFNDQQAALDRIADLAEAQQVDFVGVLGDVFERAIPRPWEILAFQAFVRRLIERKIRVLVILGNHDVKSAALPPALSIFSDLAVVALGPSLYPLDDTVIGVLPWTPTTRLLASDPGGSRDDLYERAARALVEGAHVLGARAHDEFPDQVPILVGHWAISGASLPTGLDTSRLREPVLPLNDLAGAGFKVAAFGHIHKPQILTKDPAVVFYTGSPYVCDWGEAGFAHGVWIYNTAGAGSVKFVPVEDRPFLTLEPSVEDLLEHGPEFLDQVSVEGALVRLRYTCTEEQSRAIDVAALRRRLAEAGALKVFVRQTVERAVRARVEEMRSDGLDEMAAFDLWLATQEFDGDAESLRSLHRGYLEKARA